jgi:leucyl-tRNA synthetase
MRGTAEVAVGVTQEEAVAAALELPNVQKFTAGKEIKKVIYAPGKILNLIVPNK